MNCQYPLTFLSTNVQHVQVVSFTYFFFFFFLLPLSFVNAEFFNVARPGFDVAARDPPCDRKRMVIELVQSSEFNRLRHVQSLGCNSLELNRILCDRLIWDVWQLINKDRRQFCSKTKNEHGDPNFFLSHFQEKCIRKVLAVFA